MTRVLRRTVPLLLLATLLLSADPVRSGGRDVPENKSDGSGSSTALPAPPLACGEAPTLIWVGGVPFTVAPSADGTTRLEPSLAGVWNSLVSAVRSFGFGGKDERSCP